MFDHKLRAQVKEIASRIDVEPAALMAVVAVESGGKLHARVKNRHEPLIRFEGHYFYRLLSAVKRARAITSRLASASAGKIRNPASQSGRWKLLKRACRIDRDCALQSVSWGCGQVMGAHWRWLGYASIDALVASVRRSAEGQIELMARFIRKAALCDYLNNHDWSGFARRYNGPAYKKYGYDKKMARAYKKFLFEELDHKWDDHNNRHRNLLLKLGMRGDLVRQLQRDLSANGYALRIDGDFGPVTQKAVIAFQRASDLAVDGIAGTKTFLALKRSLPVR